MQIKQSHPDVTFIFIAPPSEDELRRRLAGRGDESDETLEQRLQRAREELQYADEYDHVVENDSVQRAVDELEALILPDA
jgi:guanylate kinase